MDNNMETEQKGLSTTAVVLIVILVLLILGIGGWYWYSKSKTTTTTPTTTTPSTTETTTPTTTQPTTITDETVDWKTYTNSRVGYKFEYPSSVQTIDEQTKYPSSKRGYENEDRIAFGSDSITYLVITYVNVPHKTLEAWIEDKNTFKASSDPNDYSKITVGGQIAYEFNRGLATYVMKNGNIYSIIAPAPMSDTVLENPKNATYKHLVSTFQFTP